MRPSVPYPLNEAARQKAVDRNGVTRRPQNAELQSIVEEAAALTRSPISALSIVDRARQWFAARYGIDADEGPRGDSFCAYTILRPGEPLIVADASRDHRFGNYPSVLGHPHIRFYAGVPLVDQAGFALGALCVADIKPRLEFFNAYDLTHLARRAERILGGRSQ